jgi:hypothetical protein
LWPNKSAGIIFDKTEIGDRRMDPLEFIAWCRACQIDPSASIATVEK